jgi:hypothetical protein
MTQESIPFRPPILAEKLDEKGELCSGCCIDLRRQISKTVFLLVLQTRHPWIQIKLLTDYHA